MKNDSVYRVAKPTGRIVPVWIAVVLAILCIVLSSVCVYLYSSNSSAQVKIATLQTDIDSLTKKLDQTQIQYQAIQSKQAELEDEYATQSIQLDFYSRNYWDLMDDCSFFYTNIGFLIESSNCYHCYDCPVIQSAGFDDYLAHNLAYCMAKGYSPCTICQP